MRAALLALCLVLAPAVAAAGDAPLYTLQAEPHADGGGTDALALYAGTTDDCLGVHADARRATFTYRARVGQRPALSGTVVEGCYVIVQGVVLMVFADGDRIALPLQAFVPHGAQRPMRGARHLL